MLVYRRWDKGGDDVVVVANFTNKLFTVYEIGQSCPSAEPWKVRLSSDDVKYGVDFGTTSLPEVTTKPVARDGLPHTGAVRLPAYGLLLLSR